MVLPVIQVVMSGYEWLQVVTAGYECLLVVMGGNGSPIMGGMG